MPLPTDTPIKILVVEDDEMMRIFLRDIFWVHGRDDHYHVQTAETLNDAESIINNPETRPHVVFMGLMIPTTQGEKNSSSRIENSILFIKKIKSNKELSKLKLVVFSSQKDKALRKKVLDLGIEAFLIKGDLMPKEIIEFVDAMHV